MTHPCANHSCDHCFLCDVVGICCVSAPSRAASAADQTDAAAADRLREAIAEDVQVRLSLSQLVQIDVEVRRGDALIPKALPPGQPHTKIIVTTGEEAEHVDAPRSPRP